MKLFAPSLCLKTLFKTVLNDLKRIFFDLKSPEVCTLKTID